MSLAFEMKRFARESGLFKKSWLTNCTKMRILKKKGYHYSNEHPACTVEHFANIFTV